MWRPLCSRRPDTVYMSVSVARDRKTKHTTQESRTRDRRRSSSMSRAACPGPPRRCRACACLGGREGADQASGCRKPGPAWSRTASRLRRPLPPARGSYPGFSPFLPCYPGYSVCFFQGPRDHVTPLNRTSCCRSAGACLCCNGAAQCFPAPQL